MSDYDDEEEYEATASTTPAPEGAITVTVQEYALQHISDAAVQAIANKLSDKVMKAVDAKIDTLLDAAWYFNVEKRAQECIDAYLTKPRGKTNSYGEHIGGTITLSEKIPDAVNDYLQARVKKDGTLADSYDRNSSPTRLEWIIAKHVQAELQDETEKAAKTVTERARYVVQNHVARFISEQMVPAIEVNPGGKGK